MTRNSIFLLAFAGAACLISCFVGGVNPGGAGDQGIENSLAVQRAVLQARDYLDRGEAQKAVDVLESNLARVQGDRKFLTLLRDAYRTGIRELGFANRPDLMETYQRRLKILEDFEGKQQAIAAPASPPAAAIKGVVRPAEMPLQQPASPAAPPRITASAANANPAGDPFDTANQVGNFPAQPIPAQNSAMNLLAQANTEFLHKRYATAKHLYEQANLADARALGAEERGCWAYCQLSVVVDQVKRGAEQPSDWIKLESDVKNAIAVAPQLTSAGNAILDNIAHRRSTVRAAMPVIAVKHSSRRADGWQMAETANFRVFHDQSQEYAAKVAETAEITRSQMARKWFGKEGEDWSPKCHIFLFANSADYQQATRQPGTSPGHSRIDLDPKAGRVSGRQINLRCDNPSLFEAVLPHETTHVVLAGQFGGYHVPRWLDEGIAVLTEPQDKVQQHRKNLMKGLQNHQLIYLRELLEMDAYPAAARISIFYAQSVALVEFLSQQKGPVVLTQFARDALREGYDKALQKHYGYQSVNELQERFTERILSEVSGPQPQLAGR